MLFFYNFLIYLLVILSPVILIFRILKNKEDKIRFLEKYAFFSNKRKNGKLIWFHAVSVGELLSIIPVIESLEKKKSISQILITTSTLTSSKLFTKFKFKKTIHQFFPIDANYFTNKFINYWNPNLAIFIDSEIWPSMLNTLKNRSIKTILLNGRISKKSFKRWQSVNFFSSKLLKKFDFTYPQNYETKRHLIKLGVNKIKILGNLKFCQKLKSDLKIKKSFLQFTHSKKIWGAISTHTGEEAICIKIYKELIKDYKNLLLIIIPRDVTRLNEICKILNEYQLSYHIHSSSSRIKRNTNIYLIDTYGEAEIFLKYCKLVFIGKSLTKDGGQNPLESARNNCKIFHGPNISNFKEIYKLLGKEGISTKVVNFKDLQKKIFLFFKKEENIKLIKNKINQLGNQILKANLKELNKYL